jgi:uncharacterized protein (DUF1778 family)
MKTKDIRSEYSIAEWFLIQRAAKATRRSLRQFQAEAALTMARELTRETASPGGKETKE